MKLFGREAAVRIGDIGKDGKEFRTRIAFQVEKGSSSKPNSSQVSIWNLSEASRGFVEKAGPARNEAAGQLVRLLAGYDGELRLIFQGRVHHVEHKRSGPDVVTTLDGMDSVNEVTQARIALTFKTVTEDKIARACLDKLKAEGLKEGSIATFKARAMRGGFSYEGPVWALLVRICANQGLRRPTIQDGLVQVLEKGDGTKEELILLNERTGMIGFPTKTATGIRAKSLLHPGLVPGRKVKIESQQLTLSGVYVVQKSVFQGDTREGEFSVTIEGEPVNGGKG